MARPMNALAPGPRLGRGSQKPFLTKETARVTRALQKAQKIAGTAFHLTVMLSDDTTREMAIDRTERKLADSNHYLIYVNPHVTAEMAYADLVRICGHEVIHGVLFRVSELAEEGKKGAALAEAVDATESATYTLQRAIYGEAKVR